MRQMLLLLGAAVVVCTTTTTSSSTATTDSEQIGAFTKWLSDGGAITTNVSVVATDTAELAVKVTDGGIAAGSTILEIPRELVMSSVFAANRWPRAQADFGDDPCLVLMAYLVDEKLRGDGSSYKPFIDVLSDSPPTPVLWTGAPGYKKEANLGPALTVMSHAPSSWNALQQKYTDYKKFLDKAITFIDLKHYPNTTMWDLGELLAWAHAVVTSRAQQFGRHKCDLVPLVHLLEHDLSGAKLETTSRGKVLLKISEEVVAGGLVSRSFRELGGSSEESGGGVVANCAIELLWRFGVGGEGSSSGSGNSSSSGESGFDCLFVDVKTNLDEKSIGSNPDPQKERKRSLLEQADVKLTHNFLVKAAGELPAEAVPLLRLIAANEDDLGIIEARQQKAKEEGGAKTEKMEGVVPGTESLISLANEVRMLRQLGHALDTLDAAFKPPSASAHGGSSPAAKLRAALLSWLSDDDESDDSAVDANIERTLRKLRASRADERRRLGKRGFEAMLQRGVGAAKAVRAGERRALKALRWRVRSHWLEFGWTAVRSAEGLKLVAPMLLLVYLWAHTNYVQQGAATATAQLRAQQEAEKRAGRGMRGKIQRERAAKQKHQ